MPAKTEALRPVECAARFVLGLGDCLALRACMGMCQAYLVDVVHLTNTRRQMDPCT